VQRNSTLAIECRLFHIAAVITKCNKQQDVTQLHRNMMIERMNSDSFKPTNHQKRQMEYRVVA